MNAPIARLILYATVITLALAGLSQEIRPRREASSLIPLPIVSTALDKISPDSMLQSVRFLSLQKTRRFTSRGAVATVEFISHRLSDLGLEVEHQYVNVKDPEGHSAVVTNVLCSLSGAAPGGESIILCAHHDSRLEGWSETAPGADDNASGVAVLLEVARVLTASEITSDVLLAFFGGEEDSLIGSNAFAEGLPANDRSPRCVINVDMVGYDDYGPKDIVLFTNPRSRAIAASVARTAAAFTRLRVETVVTEEGNSDHVSFWRYDWPAISMWEGPDHNPFHLTENDLPGVLTPAFLKEVARLVTAVAIELGSGRVDDFRSDMGRNITRRREPAGRLTARVLGERLVAELPVIKGRALVVSRAGTVVDRWPWSSEWQTDRRLWATLRSAPGIYVVSTLAPGGLVPLKALAIE